MEFLATGSQNMNGASPRVQITFRDMPHSDAVEAVIRERIAKLERYSDCIVSCRVIVQEPIRRHQQGNRFTVTIDVVLPGSELAVGQGNHGARGTDARDNRDHENLYMAIRDSFQAMERQLKTYMAQRRREIRVHEAASPHATVSRLFPQDGYGFITTPEGREIYFHSNSVLNGDWETIELGALVRFAESAGDNGPQASTIELLRNQPLTGTAVAS
jgi:ribosomal subunit interface protein